jgi:hypothetical protein
MKPDRYEAFDEIGSPLDRNTVTDRVVKLLRMIEARIEHEREE